MKVAHFFAINFCSTFFQRVKKWHFWVFLAIFLVSVRSIASMGRWTLFEKLNFFWTNGHFLIFVLSALLTRVHFCFFWSFFKTPKWPFLAIFACLATRLRTSDKKVTLSNFKIDHFAIFHCFSWFRALSHFNTTRRRGTWRSKTDQAAQNRQKWSKIIKISHFQTKSAFCWFCTNFDHFELNLCIGTMCHFYFESKIL